jgi:lipopolysaccharide assembly outer membrane protein LptD (OstA)
VTKSVRVLAILAPLVAWPMAARAQQEAVQMNCPKTPMRASYHSETHERIKIPGREGAIRYIVRGDVQITCDDITVAADEIESVSDESTVTARGHVVFKETGVSITADLAVIDRSTHLGTFFTVSGAVRIGESKAGDLFGGLEPDAYFSGDSLRKTGPKTYVLTNGVLTTCTQPTPRWYMSFSGTITVGKHVYMRNLVLRLKSVPLLYLPAFYYPITENGRNTGILMPTYGSSAINGFTLSNAFFLVLGRSMDATFFHNYFQKTGMAFGGEYRYVDTSGRGNASVEVINRKAQLALGTSTVATPAETSYKFVATVNQRLPYRLTFISNDSYFSSASAQQQYQQNVYDLSQRQSRLSGKLSGARGRLGYGVLVNLFDTYTGQQSAQRSGNLPTFDFNIAQKAIRRSPVSFGMSGTSGFLIREDNLEDPTTNHSLWRTDVTPAVRAPVSKLPFLQITPQASWRFTSWSESTSAADSTHTNLPVPITRQLFTAGVSIVGPTIYRIYRPKPNDYADGFRHSISPFYNLSWNSPFHDAGRIVQLDGVDGLVGGTATMDYGVRTQLLANRWTAGRGSQTSSKEILRASISQSYFSNLLAAAYGQQDSSTGLYNAPAASPFSPVSVNITGHPVDSASASFTTRYDTHFHTLREFGVSGGLSRPLVQVNAGWNKRNLIPGLPGYDSPDSVTNYLNTSASLTHPNKHFGGSYAANLDIKFSRFLQQRYLVYYNSQCCGISFDYQTVGAGLGLPSDRRFGFSFTLAGIGSFANPFGSFGGGGS